MKSHPIPTAEQKAAIRSEAKITLVIAGASPGFCPAHKAFLVVNHPCGIIDAIAAPSANANW